MQLGNSLQFRSMLMQRWQACFISIQNEMVVKVDGLLVVLLGDAFVDAMETWQVLRVHESGAEAIHVVCELQVVPGVCVPNQHACCREQKQGSGGLGKRDNPYIAEPLKEKDWFFPFGSGKKKEKKSPMHTCAVNTEISFYEMS